VSETQQGSKRNSVYDPPFCDDLTTHSNIAPLGYNEGKDVCETLQPSEGAVSQETAESFGAL
jgi:hypothetical protein